MARSFQASLTGIQKIKEAFKLSGKTQEYIAGEVGCSRPTVNKFFNGQRIRKQTFIDLCQILKLDYRTIIELEADEIDEYKQQDDREILEELLEKVASSVENECGEMRILDMTRPIELNDIYTEVNILEKIISRRGYQVDDLIKDVDLEQFDRFCLGEIKQKRIPALEAVEHNQKLMILGKPGVGKTTFLKHLAIQSLRGKLPQQQLPIFIPLKKYAETLGKPDLFTYIKKWLTDCEIDYSQDKLTKILKLGQGLILLDGLDEVRKEDNDRIINQIEAFHRQYSNNQFAITCRIAAKEYTFTNFTEVEVADFNDNQIKNFVTSWFELKKLDNYPQYFLEQIKANQTIKELAHNPLLLTLLCLEFEDSGRVFLMIVPIYMDGQSTLYYGNGIKIKVEKIEISFIKS